MKIKIKYHSDIQKLEQISIGNWIDLKASEDMIIHKGENVKIPLGVSMKLPPNYEAHVAPRSSTFKNWGILQTNSVGVIDESYSGTNDVWQMSVYCTRDAYIEKNSRVCQFRIMEIQPKIEFEEVEELDPVDRNGFGSTGIK